MISDREHNALSAALFYLQKGWHSIPLEPGQKRPIGEAWQERRLDAPDLPREFFNGRNLGLLLGEPSAGLADVDLDCPESRTLASAFLPPTTAIFGRRSTPQSHWLYQVAPTNFRTNHYSDPVGKDDDDDRMIVELRGTGGQTMAPPSSHPSGERVEWQSTGEPAQVNFEELKNAVQKLAGGSLLARHWPNGNRHAAALALAGALLRSGWTENQVDHFVFEVARAANDEEAQARRADFRSTAAKLAKGEATTGGPTCKEIFGEPVWSKIREWLHLKSSATEPPRALRRPIALAGDYPLDALGPVMADAARAICQKVRCPASIAAQSVLAAACLSAQAHANVELPTGALRPVSLYLVTIAESGERKSAADDEALSGVAERERELGTEYEHELLEFESDAAAHKSQREQILRDRRTYETRELKREALRKLGRGPLPPPLPLLTCPEPTFEGLTRLLREGRPSIGIFSDEGGQFIGGYAMSDDNRLKTAAGLSKLWDGNGLKRVRQGDGAIALYGRRVCLHLQAQPLVASRLFGDSLLADQGLLSRILAVQPETAAGSRFWQDIAHDVKTQLGEFGQKILTNLKAPLPLSPGSCNELAPRALTLSEQARKFWIDLADHIERLVGRDGPLEPIKGLANKAPEQAARLAAVRQLLDKVDAEVIGAEAMAGGIELIQFYLSEALRIRLAARVNQDLLLAEKLLTWLQKDWSEALVSLPDIYQRGPRPIDDKATAVRIVTILVDHGWLVPVEGLVEVNGETRRQAWRIVRTEV